MPEVQPVIGLLICIGLCVLAGLVLLVAMARRDDGFLGLVGLSTLMAAGMLGAVYAAYSSG
jgi:hypothetical protein